MTKNRSNMPKAVREDVLKEFSHMCAICGKRDPQIHHIDENHDNHSLLNLLPLCPNHHLSDQHNPTKKIEPNRLRLFRSYKDPSILKPQFEPLYRRLICLARPEHPDFYALRSDAVDLCSFVGALSMGEYYAKRLNALLEISDLRSPIAGVPFELGQQAHRQAMLRAELANRINERYEELTRLCVELLRYQHWPEIREPD
jgi:hypothetical protein